MDPKWWAQQKLHKAARTLPADQLRGAHPAIQLARLLQAAADWVNTSLAQEQRCEQLSSRRAADTATRRIAEAREDFIATALEVLGLPAWPPEVDDQIGPADPYVGLATRTHPDDVRRAAQLCDALNTPAKL